MKKPPKIKGYANGGDVPKTKAEFDKYYSTNPNYARDPLYSGTRYYDKTKLTFDPVTKKYSGAGMTGGIGEGNPEAKYFVEFQEPKQTIIPSAAKSVNVDSGRKPIFTDSPYYQSFQLPDESGQYGINSKTVHYDKKTNLPIDVSKSFDLTGKYVPAFKYGGLVKGYQGGGFVNDQNQFTDKGNAVAGIGGQLANLGGSYLQSQSVNANGTVNEGQAALGGALSGGAKGLALGANPALMAATGGLSAPIGAIAGAGLGAGLKYFGAKKLNRDIEFGNTLAENQKNYATEQNVFQQALNKQMQEREAGYKHGGVVRGQGGPKDDKVKAKVEAGSFIVPAEKVSELKKVMKAPKKKEVVNLNQKGGTEIKLSKGEWVLTPEEKQEIISELGEEFLEHLAPNAEHENEVFREGGLTPAKAKIMLHEGMANGKPLTDKQRGYFGLIAGGYKCGGMVKGMKDGGDVDGEDPSRQAIFDKGIKEYQKKKDKELADKEIAERDKINSQIAKIESLKDKTGYDKVELKFLKERKGVLDKKYGESKIYSDTEANIEKKTGTGKTGGVKTSPKVGKVTAENLPSKSILTTKSLDERLYEELTPAEKAQFGNVAKPKEYTGRDERYEKDLAEAEALGNTQNKKSDLINQGLKLGTSQLGSLANYFLPYQQYKMGQKYLAESGNRPVDRIDPDFQNAVNQAQVNAKYGYTPEEQALLNQQNINALRAGQNAARLYGGGGAGSYVLSRDAANQYYTRGLQGLIGNRNLQLQKQAEANNLVMARSDKSRQLFNDQMNAWTQNQQAGGNLVGSALSNALQVNRYNQEKKFQDELASRSNPWTNYNITT